MGIRRVCQEPIRDLSGDRRHLGSDRTQHDRNVGMLDGARIEERLQPSEAVVLSLEAQRAPALEAREDRPQRLDVLAHARRRRGPRRAVAADDVAAHLGAEAQLEAPCRRGLEVPGRMGHRHRAAREGDQHAEQDLEPGRGVQRHRRDQHAIVDPVGHVETVIARCLRPLGERPDLRRRRPLMDRCIDLEHAVDLSTCCDTEASRLSRDAVLRLVPAES